MTDPTVVLSLADAAVLIRSGELSPVEYAEELLRRVSRHDDHLNSFLHVATDIAMSEATAAEKEIQEGRWRGPLHGVPYGLKDVIDYDGIPTTAHSRLLANNVPRRDAAITASLKSAGAVCLGKLSAHEFALGGPAHDLPWPPARNPWNREHHPGGSSSGCGAAVAAGFLPLAIGTDTGGSVRHPASACGVVGMKPTYELLSRRGTVPLSFSLDHVGLLTRTVRDSAIALGSIMQHSGTGPSGSEVGAEYTAYCGQDVRGLRVGYIRHFHLSDTPDADADVVASLDLCAEQLARMGADVEEVTVEPLASYRVAHNVIMLAEAYSIHESTLRERPSDYGSLTRRLLLQGAYLTAADYMSALKVRGIMSADFEKGMAGYDVLLCASSMDLPARFDEPDAIAQTYWRHARMVFNLLGYPALTVPTGIARGLPLSVQIVGKPFEEGMVYRVASAVEASSSFTPCMPTLGVGCAT